MEVGVIGLGSGEALVALELDGGAGECFGVGLEIG